LVLHDGAHDCNEQLHHMLEPALVRANE